MNLFDYLFACSFWQWIGTIALAGAITGPIAALGTRIRNYHQNAARYDGMNSGMVHHDHKSSQVIGATTTCRHATDAAPVRKP